LGYDFPDITVMDVDVLQSSLSDSIRGYEDRALVIPTLSQGYARTYCCPTRGIVLGFSEVGMVGMKGVVGGSEGRRGE